MKDRVKNFNPQIKEKDEEIKKLQTEKAELTKQNEDFEEKKLVPLK